jgi:SNF2 family DNA or RNA helicase
MWNNCHINWASALIKEAALKPHVKLRKHQKAGLEHLERSGGTLFNWRTGSGKTIGSLAALENLKSKGKAKTTLVLTPAPLTTNYHDSIKEHTDSSAQIIGKGRGGVHIDKAQPGHSYYLVSNEIFRKDPHRVMNQIKPDSMIVDEIHKYKDPSSKGYKALMAVRPKVKHMLALTGTPVTNHPKDAISVLDLVSNKQHRLGEYKDFDKNFTKKVKGELKFTDMLQGRKAPEIVKPKNTDYFKREAAKHVHTFQTRPDNMPIKDVEHVNVEMSKPQQKLYNYVMKKNLSPIEAWKIQNNWPMSKSEAKHVFTALQQSRQVSNSIHLFDKNFENDPVGAMEYSPKLKKVLEDVVEHLNEHKDHKAIIYSNMHKGSLDAVQAILNKHEIGHGTYLGTKHVKPKERDQHVQDYLSGKRRVMLINQAGTEGVNLPGTTFHAAMDGHFNPAVIHQAEARGVRSGSPVKKVKVRRYVSTSRPGFWGRVTGKKPQAADEWVYNIAKEKSKFNKAFKLQ